MKHLTWKRRGGSGGFFSFPVGVLAGAVLATSATWAGADVTVPYDGENWIVGESREIRWDAIGGCDLVDLDLFQGDESVCSIATNVANSGRYQWVVSDCGRGPGCNFRVVVTCDGETVSSERFGIDGLLIDVVEADDRSVEISWSRVAGDTLGANTATTSAYGDRVFGGYNVWRKTWNNLDPPSKRESFTRARTVDARIVDTDTLETAWTFFRPQEDFGFDRIVAQTFRTPNEPVFEICTARVFVGDVISSWESELALTRLVDGVPDIENALGMADASYGSGQRWLRFEFTPPVSLGADSTYALVLCGRPQAVERYRAGWARTNYDAFEDGIPMNAVLSDEGSWRGTIGGGFNGPVNAILALGSNVLAGGAFTQAGDEPVSNMAFWNGESWSELDDGMDAPVHVLASLGGGTLVAGGEFQTAGGDPASNIAEYSDGEWISLGDGLDDHVFALAVQGEYLFAGGRFTQAGDSLTNRIAMWNGSTWNALGEGVNDDVLALAVLDGDLIVGGRFTEADGEPIDHIAQWTGIEWNAMDIGVDGDVNVIETFEGDLIVAGEFTEAAGLPANRIARWTGATWESLGDGLNGEVHGMLPYGDGLYVVGAFTEAGGQPASGIARWDGYFWSPLDSGVDGEALAVAIVDPRSCRELDRGSLVVGGEFANAGSHATPNLAVWDDRVWLWSDLGIGDFAFTLGRSAAPDTSCYSWIGQRRAGDSVRHFNDPDSIRAYGFDAFGNRIRMERPGPHNGFRLNYAVTAFDRWRSYSGTIELPSACEDTIFADDDLATGIQPSLAAQWPEDLNPQSTLSTTAPLLSRVYPVPNPYVRRADDPSWPAWELPGQHKVQFMNLPTGAVVKIYTLAGDLVRTLRHTSREHGSLNWDLRNEGGELVTSGIYMWFAESENGEKKYGQLVLVF